MYPTPQICEEVKLEILAFLLIGLIAMLAIVPPIIRGRIDASPLTTTEDFQKSMFQMGTSLDLENTPLAEPSPVTVKFTHHGGAATAPEMEWQPVEVMRPVEVVQPEKRISRPPSAARARSKVSVKRNRILTTITLAAAGSALLALIIENRATLVLFVISCVLLLSYCLLLLVVPALLRARRRPPRITQPMSLRRS